MAGGQLDLKRLYLRFMLLVVLPVMVIPPQYVPEGIGTFVPLFTEKFV